MRYCPRCQRFNPGNPPICHYCGATWYVRLCPRGHENPPNAQFCGTCGSTDLSETAGRRPWLLIASKTLAWVLAGLLVYSLVSAVGSIEWDHAFGRIAAVAIGPCLLVLGLWLALSLLPAAVGRSVRRMMTHGLKLCGLAVWGVLRLVWRILK